MNIIKIIGNPRKPREILSLEVGLPRSAPLARRGAPDRGPSIPGPPHGREGGPRSYGGPRS